MSIKITLDKGALEALIAGNSEVEVELRNTIVQNFAKRHLKNLANDEITKIATETISRATAVMRLTIEETVKQIIGGWDKDGPWKYIFALTPACKEEIKKQTAYMMDHLIFEAKQELRKDMTEKIAKAKEQIQGEVARTIEERVTKAQYEVIQTTINARLKQLGEEMAKG